MTFPAIMLAKLACGASASKEFCVEMHATNSGQRCLSAWLIRQYSTLAFAKVVRLDEGEKLSYYHQSSPI